MCLDFNCFVTVRYFFAYYSTGTSLHSYISSSEKLANFLGPDLHLHMFDFFLYVRRCDSASIQYY
jgi:hypothetical protein